jgi:ATP-dependent protease ClpP protease subunit
MKTFKTVRNTATLREGRVNWYRITNLASGVGAEVSIFDEIGYFGITAQDFLHDLAGVKGPLTLRLNSPGGEIFDGIAIYNALRARGSISIVIDGLAASIASVIAMAADPGQLSIAKRASMMIHDGFSQAIGNAQDMRELADLLDQQSDNIAGIYADRTGKTSDYWRTEMRKETWYTGDTAVAAGLADRVVDNGPVVTNNWDLSVFRNTPANQLITARVSPTRDAAQAALLAAGFTAEDAKRVLAADTPAAGDEALGDGWVMRGGKPVFDPDGDGDDDATAEGDTDHDYFAPDGTQKKAIPPCPGHPGTGKPLPADKAPVVVYNAGVDGSTWDASKAWHAGASSDDPAAFYKAICAGRRSGDPALQSSWALPYRYSPSSPPNAAGVHAALSRLSSTQGLTNKAEAQAKLESLMKEINPDYEPADNFIDPQLLQSLFTHALEGGK